MVDTGRLQKTRIKVFYFSKSGNTKKVAEAIAAEMKTDAIDVASHGGNYGMKDCDLLLVGSGVYWFKAGNEMVKFLETLAPSEGKCAAVFGTHGSRDDHIAQMKKILEGKGLKVIGEWSCPGQEYAMVNKGRPNQEDLKEAREFARRMLWKVEVL
jgi:flavodoxin